MWAAFFISNKPLRMIEELTAEYNAEAERIELLRLATWSSAAMEYDLCGLPCRPLTLQAWIDLKGACNGVFANNSPTMGDLAAYVWRNHLGYSTANDDAAKRIKKSITESLKKLSDIETVAEVYEHISDAFGETSEDSNPKSDAPRANGFPAVMDAVYAIDEIGHRYGMRPAEVLAMPVAQIFHLQKAIRSNTNPDYRPAKPDSLRQIDGRILEAMNNG